MMMWGDWSAPVSLKKLCASFKHTQTFCVKCHLRSRSCETVLSLDYRECHRVPRLTRTCTTSLLHYHPDTWICSLKRRKVPSITPRIISWITAASIARKCTQTSLHIKCLFTACFVRWKLLVKTHCMWLQSEMQDFPKSFYHLRSHLEMHFKQYWWSSHLFCA